jgi:hypothetical protein
MRQISNKYWIISIETGKRFLTVYRGYGNRIRIVDNIGDAMQFTDPYLALETWAGWVEANKYNYTIAPILQDTEIEEIVIVRKIIKISEYPARDAKLPQVITEAQAKHLAMWGHPTEGPSPLSEQPHLYSHNID